MPNISYHTRLYGNNTVKVCGGSFGGSLDIVTANRLISAHFSGVVKNSGTAVFVDKKGREVSLYISVDVSTTDRGVLAIKQWRQEKVKQEALEEVLQRSQEEEIGNLMDGLSHEEIVRRLSGNN